MTIFAAKLSLYPFSVSFLILKMFNKSENDATMKCTVEVFVTPQNSALFANLWKFSSS